jgi:hypothetical protein
MKLTVEIEDSEIEELRDLIESWIERIEDALEKAQNKDHSEDH